MLYWKVRDVVHSMGRHRNPEASKQGPMEAPKPATSYLPLRIPRARDQKKKTQTRNMEGGKTGNRDYFKGKQIKP